MKAESVADRTCAFGSLTPTRGALLALLACLWLAMLGMRSLVSADEGRYATLSLGMLQSGDWIVPRLNGLLYFEKPPLQYWAGALSMAVFGPNEFAARLWPGLCGLACVAGLAWTAARLHGRASGWCALAAGGSTTWIVANSQFLSLDAGLMATLALVLCTLLLAEHERDERQRRRWLRLAWLGVALALLSKGLVGIVIPAAALVVRAAWERDLRFWRGLEWRSGPFILLLVAAPWFIAVSWREPAFARFFFIHEHFERFLTPVHRREGAWWSFVPVLLVGLLPWTAALPALLRPRDRAERLLLAWAGFVFVFFSASSSKLPSYILPMFPALVLLLAPRLAEAGTARLARWLALAAVAWLAVLAAVPFAERWAGPETPPHIVFALARGFALAAVVALVGAALAALALRRGARGAAIGCLAVGHLLALFVAIAAHDAYGQLKTSAVLARTIPSEVPVFAVGEYDQTLPFYLRRDVTLVAIVDEFALGERLEPARWIPTLEAFVERWRQLPRAAAYLTQDTLAELRKRGVEGRVTYEDPRRIVIVKP
ncbi:MAG: glycosyltransferase family 39 protein [Burkholderiales bacterium]|nr:glycosyltransferase family 39 protein [Burkholderiales bacterium]